MQNMILTGIEYRDMWYTVYKTMFVLIWGNTKDFTSAETIKDTSIESIKIACPTLAEIQYRSDPIHAPGRGRHLGTNRFVDPDNPDAIDFMVMEREKLGIEKFINSYWQKTCWVKILQTLNTASGNRLSRDEVIRIRTDWKLVAVLNAIYDLVWTNDLPKWTHVKV